MFIKSSKYTLTSSGKPRESTIVNLTTTKQISFRQGSDADGRPPYTIIFFQIDKNECVWYYDDIQTWKTEKSRVQSLCGV